MGGNVSKTRNLEQQLYHEKTKEDDDCFCDLFGIKKVSKRDLDAFESLPLVRESRRLLISNSNQYLEGEREVENAVTPQPSLPSPRKEPPAVTGNYLCGLKYSELEKEENRDVSSIESSIEKHELFEKYELCEVLGVGSTSMCYRCLNLETGKSYACKIIEKKLIESKFLMAGFDTFRSEIAALKTLNHPNIIKLYDVCYTDEQIYIVMEYMEGGELFEYVVQRGSLKESETAEIMTKITSALYYMHSKNIIHRDLKPENLLLKRKPRTPQHVCDVKIIDFGLSKRLEEGHIATRSFSGGTRGYLAPEMLQRQPYTSSVDTWALGIILYVLLCGCLPFGNDVTPLMTEQDIQARFQLKFPRWAKNLSPQVKDLLNHLLDRNPYTRYSAEQAIHHPWLEKHRIQVNSIPTAPNFSNKNLENCSIEAAVVVPRTPNEIHQNEIGRNRAHSWSSVDSESNSRNSRRSGKKKHRRHINGRKYSDV